MIPEAAWQAVLEGAQALSRWEALAVLLGIAYLLLAMRESLWCWYAGFASTAIFLVIFWDVRLLMEAGLQVYYLVMSVYGWWHWRQGATEETPLPIRRWSLSQHVAAAALIILAAGLSGSLLSSHTDAALPYMDSFTTWGSILTTWMVARKILENWLYWLVIDSVSIYLYLNRELYLTALLFAVYLVIAVFGYLRWRQHFLQQSS